MRDLLAITGAVVLPDWSPTGRLINNKETGRMMLFDEVNQKAYRYL